MFPPPWPLHRQHRRLRYYTSNAEQVGSTQSLRIAILSFTTEASNAACLRVSQAWFQDGVRILYRETLGIPLFDPKSHPRAIWYNNPVKNLVTPIAGWADQWNGKIVPSVPFSDIRIVPNDFARTTPRFRFLYPNISQASFIMAEGINYGKAFVRYGADQAIMSFDTAMGWRSDCVYIERVIFVSPHDKHMDHGLFDPPTIKGLEVEMTMTLYYRTRSDEVPVEPTQASGSRVIAEDIVPLLTACPSTVSFRSLIFGTSELDITTLIQLCQRPFRPSPFDRLEPTPRLEARLQPFTLRQFESLAQTATVQAMKQLHLGTPRPQSPTPLIGVQDLDALYECVSTHLPKLENLQINLSFNSLSESALAHTLTPECPPGKLRGLTVTLHLSKEPKFDGLTPHPTLILPPILANPSTMFPFNLIRRLMSFVASGGSLVLQWKLESGVFCNQVWTDDIKWVKQQPSEELRSLLTLDYFRKRVSSLEHLQALLYCPSSHSHYDLELSHVRRSSALGLDFVNLVLRSIPFMPMDMRSATLKPVFEFQSLLENVARAAMMCHLIDDVGKEKAPQIYQQPLSIDFVQAVADIVAYLRKRSNEPHMETACDGSIVPNSSPAVSPPSSGHTTPMPSTPQTPEDASSKFESFAGPGERHKTRRSIPARLGPGSDPGELLPTSHSDVEWKSMRPDNLKEFMKMVGSDASFPDESVSEDVKALIVGYRGYSDTMQALERDRQLRGTTYPEWRELSDAL